MKQYNADFEVQDIKQEDYFTTELDIVFQVQTPLSHDSEIKKEF